jgi:hypothetical protein
MSRVPTVTVSTGGRSISGANGEAGFRDPQGSRLREPATLRAMAERGGLFWGTEIQSNQITPENGLCGTLSPASALWLLPDGK